MSGPVAAAVKSKLRATGPLMPDIPEHGCTVLLIERIARINEEKPPILLLTVLLEEDTHCMDGALYPGLKAAPYLSGTAGGL